MNRCFAVFLLILFVIIVYWQYMRMKQFVKHIDSIGAIVMM